MYLPGYVMACVEALENAGFAAYAVGGCVRDACLGLTPHDYDLCTDALPEQMQQVFADHRLVLAGLKHGTVGVIAEEGVVEITTFRTEGIYLDNRHPESVSFVSDIREDLARRDFTVNAMAWSPSRGFADPFGGRQDLRDGILRAVGDAETRFREDALRILRGVRFAVRFGLRVEEETERAMCACAPRMDSLARERVFTELCALLPLAGAADLRRFAPVLSRVIPELEPMVGYDQQTRYHVYDLYTHTALVTEHVPRDLVLRWAALLHDIGKISCRTDGEDGQAHYYGHAECSARMAEEVLLRLKAPTALRQQAVLLIRHHMVPLEADRKLLRRRMNQLGRETVRQLYQLQCADRKGTGRWDEAQEALAIAIDSILTEIEEENACLKVTDLQVNGRDLMALGYQGPAIGSCLNRLLEQVMEEKTENNREQLLLLAGKWKEETL